MDAEFYKQVTKRLKLEPGTYRWAKDYFNAWQRSKAGLLDNAIESYADGVPRSTFDRHLKEDTAEIAKFTTVKELLLYIARVAEQEGFI